MKYRSLFLIFLVIGLMCGSYTWNAGSWDVTFVGTYTEAQTEITGVEVMP